MATRIREDFERGQELKGPPNFREIASRMAETSRDAERQKWAELRILKRL